MCVCVCVCVCVCSAFSVEILTNILNHNLYNFQGITIMLIFLEIMFFILFSYYFSFLLLFFKEIPMF